MSDDKKRKERSVLRRFRRLDSFNQDKKTGSIKVGKTADLVLVEAMHRSASPICGRHAS